SASGAKAGPAGSSSAGSQALDTPLRPEDVERQLRMALRTAEKGDPARAARVLDQILVIEPLNREALSGRASLALDEFPRASSPYSAMLQSIDAANLAKARERVKDHLNQPLDMAFAFTLPDLDGKPVSLAGLKGKIVIIDLWGTWCKPCRETIPHLVELYRK